MAPPRILLVDDEENIRDLLANVLLAEGYDVDVTGTVAEAMSQLDRSTYRLVLTDWRLPDGDGLLISDAGSEAGAATIIMSGYLFQIPSGVAKRHEALMKPLRPSEVVAAVERAIGKARAC